MRSWRPTPPDASFDKLGAAAAFRWQHRPAGPCAGPRQPSSSGAAGSVPGGGTHRTAGMTTPTRSWPAGVTGLPGHAARPYLRLLDSRLEQLTRWSAGLHLMATVAAAPPLAAQPALALRTAVAAGAAAPRRCCSRTPGLLTGSASWRLHIASAVRGRASGGQDGLWALGLVIGPARDPQSPSGRYSRQPWPGSSGAIPELARAAGIHLRRAAPWHHSLIRRCWTPAPAYSATPAEGRRRRTLGRRILYQPTLLPRSDGPSRADGAWSLCREARTASLQTTWG